MKRYRRNLSALALGLTSLALLIGCGRAEELTSAPTIQHARPEFSGKKFITANGAKIGESDDKDDKKDTPTIEIIIVETLELKPDAKLKEAYLKAWDKAEEVTVAAQKAIAAATTKEKKLEVYKKKVEELKPFQDAEEKAALALVDALKPELEKLDFYKAFAKKVEGGKVVVKLLLADRERLMLGFYSKEPKLKDGKVDPEPFGYRAIDLTK